MADRSGPDKTLEPVGSGGTAMPSAAAAPPDPVWDDWETPLRAPTTPQLHLDGFDGPMDVLFNLAKRQRIDLGRLSIAALAEQFAAELDGRLRGQPLERRADWLVLATGLLLLRSRLLFPANAAEAASAARDAAGELAGIEASARARAAAAWLQVRPQLGRDVFVQPARGPDPRVASYMALMEACLVVLRGTAGRPQDAPVYHPVLSGLWRVSDASARLRAMLAERPEGGGLTMFLPPIAGGTGFERRARAAVTSTFVAALELSRAGEAELEQAEPFGEASLHMDRRQ